MKINLLLGAALVLFSAAAFAQDSLKGNAQTGKDLFVAKGC